MKFDDSMTEDDIEERSFRSLLPSEAHRRESLDRKPSAHPESDDDHSHDRSSPRVSSKVISFQHSSCHTSSGSSFVQYERWCCFFLFGCHSLFVISWCVDKKLSVCDYGYVTQTLCFSPAVFISRHTQQDDSMPFSSGQDSFSKFTMDLVRQYMKEEEVRAQHQSSLLRLRQKALREKTKTELAWLEHQKRQDKHLCYELTLTIRMLKLSDVKY